MAKLWFENSDEQHRGVELYQRIRNDEPSSIVKELLVLGDGNPSLTIRALVDLCVEEEYPRAKELITSLKDFTHGDNEKVVQNGGHDHIYTMVASLLILEHAYLLAEINNDDTENALLVLSRVRQFSKAHSLPIVSALNSEKQHQEMLSSFDFFGQHPVKLFEAMFINHLLNQGTLSQ